MRVELRTDQITWGIETEDGSFDEFTLDVPEGLPFDRGLVVFKTHAYTPVQHGNLNTYTFHWDNIRFSGPVTGVYETFEATEVVYLQANGNRPVGDKQTVSVTLPRTGPNPVLFGQLHQPLRGQVLLRVNGGDAIEINPYSYGEDNCVSGQWRDWKSFRLELDPDVLRVGDNQLEWEVGPRPACAAGRDDYWDGFSAKFLQVQLDSPTLEQPLFVAGFE